jgi:hypothetical protein
MFIPIKSARGTKVSEACAGVQAGATTAMVGGVIWNDPPRGGGGSPGVHPPENAPTTIPTPIQQTAQFRFITQHSQANDAPEYRGRIKCVNGAILLDFRRAIRFSESPARRADTQL